MAERYAKLDDPNFDYDPLTGVRQRLVIDDNGGFHLENTQDDTPMREFAHESRGNYSRFEKFRDIQPVARVPVLVIYDLIKRGIWNDPERKRKWLNSIEGAPYRLRDFKV